MIYRRYTASLPLPPNKGTRRYRQARLHKRADKTDFISRNLHSYIIYNGINEHNSPIGFQVGLHGSLDRGEVASVGIIRRNDILDGGDGVRPRFEDGVSRLDGLGLEGRDG